MIELPLADPPASTSSCASLPLRLALVLGVAMLAACCGEDGAPEGWGCAGWAAPAGACPPDEPSLWRSEILSVDPFNVPPEPGPAMGRDGTVCAEVVPDRELRGAHELWCWPAGEVAHERRAAFSDAISHAALPTLLHVDPQGRLHHVRAAQAEGRLDLRYGVDGVEESVADAVDFGKILGIDRDREGVVSVAYATGGTVAPGGRPEGFVPGDPTSMKASWGAAHRRRAA